MLVIHNDRNGMVAQTFDVRVYSTVLGGQMYNMVH